MKRMTRRIQAFGALAVALSVSACDDATGLDVLDDAIVFDLAVMAADATLEVVSLWGQPLGFSSGPQATPGQPGGQRGFSDDLSGTRSVTFYNEAGGVMPNMDPLLTASMHIVHEVAGTITRDNFTATIKRDRNMIVSGLLDEETHRTWNGGGSSSMSRSGVREDGTARAHDMSGTAEYHDVVVPIPGSDPRYPESGTITRNMTATWTTDEGTGTRDVTMVITFDGSATAMAVVNGEPMEIDLAARQGRSPFKGNRGG